LIVLSFRRRPTATTTAKHDHERGTRLFVRNNAL
jgi:hypothetical protein